MIKLFDKNGMFLFFVLFFAFSGIGYGQIYYHTFLIGATTYPYNVAPTQFNPNLSNSSWSNSSGEWVSYLGESDYGLGAKGNETITLNFDVNLGNQMSISSFNFFAKKLSGGPQNWSVEINGVNVGSGSISLDPAGAEVGDHPVSSAFVGITGGVTVVITLSGATSSTNYNFILDNFKIDGLATPICAPQTISSISPNNGPTNTFVTINGSNFLTGEGVSALNFNGVSTTNFNVISDSVIEAFVPAGNTTGLVNIMSGNCEIITFKTFTRTNPPGVDITDIYISELYDSEEDGAFIELYNASSGIISLADFRIDRYANSSDTNLSYSIPLSGSVGSGEIILIGMGLAPCNVFSNLYHPLGINATDRLELMHNNSTIDVVITPDDTGYTMKRLFDAVAPSLNFVITDWDISLTEICENLGAHTTIFAPFISHPINKIACENGTISFSVSVENPSDYTYQWKTLNFDGDWINIMNSGNVSGSSTATLTINPVSMAFQNSQYYCEMISSDRNLISNAARLRVSDGMPPITDFSYVPIICQNSTTIVPTTVTGFTIGGVFSSDSGLVINPNSGAINPSLSSLGLHVIEYSYGLGAEDCNGAGTSSFEIFIENSNEYITDFSYQTPICITEGNSQILPNLIAGFNSGGTFSSDSGLIIDSITGEISVALSSLGIHVVTYTVAETITDCDLGGTTFFEILIEEMPDLTPNQGDDSVCVGETTTFSNAAAGGTWSTSDITIATVDLNGVVTGISSGNVNIIYTLNSSCTAVETSSITVGEKPNPELEDTYLCVNNATGEIENFVTLHSGISNSGFVFEWRLNGNVLATTGNSHNVIQAGLYEVVATNTVTGCSESASCTVYPSATAVATAITTDFSANQSVTVVVAQGSGNYLYAIDNGQFQESNVFENVSSGEHVITIKDTNGCNDLFLNVYLLNYPNFFTPNGDGVNDFWRINGLSGRDAKIYIYDRFGKLLKYLNGSTDGWDGTFEGQPVFSSDYWFRILYKGEDGTNKEFKSHFSLVR